jgi:hypothetical protein
MRNLHWMGKVPSALAGPSKEGGTWDEDPRWTNGERIGSVLKFDQPRRQTNLKYKIMKKTLLTAGFLLGMCALVSNARADLAVGDDAPDFSLQGSDGKTYTLSDFKGKQAVVVAWYPKAFTGG